MTDGSISTPRRVPPVPIDRVTARSGLGLAYGYFFVEGEVAAFVETVGLDVGAENLRVLADEVDARLLGG